MHSNVRDHQIKIIIYVYIHIYVAIYEPHGSNKPITYNTYMHTKRERIQMQH